MELFRVNQKLSAQRTKHCTTFNIRKVSANGTNSLHLAIYQGFPHCRQAALGYIHGFDRMYTSALLHAHKMGALALYTSNGTLGWAETRRSCAKRNDRSVELSQSTHLLSPFVLTLRQRLLCHVTATGCQKCFCSMAEQIVTTKGGWVFPQTSSNVIAEDII